jgi:hypothetical protein
MQIQYIEIDQLIPYERNPRKNDQAVDAVAASIKEFGFKVPIVIDSNNIIVAGHTRYKAAKTLGMDTVPCIIADDLTDEQVRAFRLVDNKTSELAEWDLDLLSIELDDISTIDMGSFGFEEAIEDKEAIEDNYEIELPEEPRAKIGDVYQLGNHRVMCGDSTDASHVEILMDEQLAEMIFTDPPYNVDYEGTAGKIMNDKMEDNTFYLFLFQAFKNMFDHTKPGGAIYVCHADTEGINFRTAFKNAGFKLAECLVWVKNALVLGRQDYH